MSESDKKDNLFSQPHVAGGMVRPFIQGSKVQLARYIEANEFASKHKIMDAYHRCLYEASSLLEHLATVVTYIENVDVKLQIHETIKDFRHHIRHDARGEFDEKRSKKRAERLGLNDKLLVGVEFPLNAIKIGNTELTTDQIGQYLDSVDTLAYGLMLGVTLQVSDDGVAVSQSEQKNADK